MGNVNYLLKYIIKLLVKVIFGIMKFFPLKNEYILLDSWKGQNLSGNLLCIYNELIKYREFKLIVIGNNNEFKSKNTIICRSKSLRHMYYLAVSKYWVVDTIYYDFAKPRKDTKYILIWHAAGVFKKFGISTLNDKKLIRYYERNGKNLSYLVVSSEKIKKIYSKELCVPEEKMVCFGLPRTDEFVNKKSNKQKIYEKYGINKKKKIILYAPTFRGEGYSEFNINLDYNLINEHLKDTYVIIVKLHPNNYIKNNKINNSIIISANDNILDLMIASDCLITDYSSVIFEYSLLKKPQFFYAYDLEKYENKERGFYMDYKSFVPGPIIYDTNGLINEIENYDFNRYREKINNIADDYQVHDGKCRERFINYFFNKDLR